uniref:DUF5641 domain-containing protein n=1 Tax=Loa loa TaxID=7209 RepID=A0A1I7VTL2_LOALO
MRATANCRKPKRFYDSRLSIKSGMKYMKPISNYEQPYHSYQQPCFDFESNVDKKIRGWKAVKTPTFTGDNDSTWYLMASKRFPSSHLPGNDSTVFTTSITNNMIKASNDSSILPVSSARADISSNLQRDKLMLSVIKAGKEKWPLIDSMTGLLLEWKQCLILIGFFVADNGRNVTNVETVDHMQPYLTKMELQLRTVKAETTVIQTKSIIRKSIKLRPTMSVQKFSTTDIQKILRWNSTIDSLPLLADGTHPTWIIRRHLIKHSNTTNCTGKIFQKDFQEKKSRKAIQD